jgi:hypothetical protein
VTHVPIRERQLNDRELDEYQKPVRPTPDRLLGDVLTSRWGGPPLEVPNRLRWAGDSLFQAETLRQAQTFETYKGHYVAAGLCFYCAAQAAYGHQHGFPVVEQPRHRECAEVILTLPVPQVNRWRSLGLSGRSARNGQEPRSDGPEGSGWVESVKR